VQFSKINIKMTQYNKLEKIQNKCLSYIQNKPPNIAVREISNIVKNDNRALQIYESGAKYSVPYDDKKYKNNINEYKSKLNKNINSARREISKKK